MRGDLRFLGVVGWLESEDLKACACSWRIGAMRLKISRFSSVLQQRGRGILLRENGIKVLLHMCEHSIAQLNVEKRRLRIDGSSHVQDGVRVLESDETGSENVGHLSLEFLDRVLQGAVSFDIFYERLGMADLV